MPQETQPIQEADISKEKVGFKKQTALQVRMALGTHALDSNYAHPSEVKQITGIPKDVDVRIQERSLDERSTQTKSVQEWCDHTTDSIRNSHNFFENTPKGQRYAEALKKGLGIDVLDFTSDAAEKVYTEYGEAENGATSYADKILEKFESLPPSELEKNLDAFEWFGNIFGENTAQVLAQRISLQKAIANDDGKELLAEANKTEDGVLAINRPNPDEIKLLEFLSKTPYQKKPETSPPPDVKPPDTNVPPIPTAGKPPEPVVLPPPSGGTPEAPENESLKKAREEIFERAGKRTLKEAEELIDSVTELHNQEREKGKGKMLPTIAEMKAAGINEVVRDGFVTYIPDGKGELVVVGDIHGDYATVKHLIEKTEFLENMETGDKSKTIVFMGDLVDRGEKDIEVMEALLALKQRYPDNVVILKADHEVVSGISHHDFPRKVLEHYYGGTSPGETDESTPLMKEHFSALFDVLPRMAVAGSGVVMVHGGPSGQEFNLSQLAGLSENDARQVFDNAMTWADVVSDKALGYIRNEANVKILQNQLNFLREQAQKSPDKHIRDSDGYTWTIDKLDNIEKRIDIALKNGFWFNEARVSADNVLHAVRLNRIIYSEVLLKQMLDDVGGNVMIRGHQTTDDVGHDGNPLSEPILWTIHSTGNGSPDAYSSYQTREVDPKYAVFDKSTLVKKLGIGENILPVWGTNPK